MNPPLAPTSTNPIQHPHKIPHRQAPKKKSRNKLFVAAFAILKLPFKILNACCFWKKKPVKLSKEQKETMEKIHTDPAYLLTKKIRPVAPADPNTPDVALESMHDFITQFTANFAECLFDEKLKDPLQQIKSGAKALEEGIRPVLTFLIETGDNAIATLSSSPNLVEDIKKVAQLDELFKWLCTDQAGKNLRQDIEKNLPVKIAELAKGKIVLPGTPDWQKPYSDKVLDWIFATNHNLDSIFETDTTPNKEKAIYNIVIKAALQLLIENKVEYFKGRFKNVFQDKIDVITKEFLKNSAQKIGEKLTERLSAQIQTFDYPGTYDAIVQIVSEHIEAYISAEKKADELIKKAKHIQSVKATTKEQKETLDSLKIISAAIKTEKEFSVKKKLMAAAFAEEPACDRAVRNMIIVPDEAHRENTTKSAENLFYEKLSATALEILLPQKTYQEDGSDKGGLEILWDDLLNKKNLPKEIAELYEELKETLEKLAPQSSKEQITKFSDSVFSIAKTLTLGAVENLLVQQVSGIARQIAEKLSNPDSLEELLGEKIFPAMTNQLLVTAARQTMLSRKNVKKIAELYVRASKETDPTAVKKEIADTVYTLTKKTFRSFSSQEIPDEAEGGFQKLIAPLIDDIETMLKLTRKPDGSVRETISLLEAYGTGVAAEKNPNYESIIMGASSGISTFKVFGGEGLSKALLNTLKGPLAQQFSNAAYSLNHSYVKPLHSIASTAQDSLGSREQINELFFKEKEKVNPVQREAKLRQEINKTSRLANDILRQSVKNSYGSSLLIFAPSVKSCDKFLTELVQKLLFTDPAINKSLIFRVETTALDALKKANSPAGAIN